MFFLISSFSNQTRVSFCKFQFLRILNPKDFNFEHSIPSHSNSLNRFQFRQKHSVNQTSPKGCIRCQGGGYYNTNDGDGGKFRAKIIRQFRFGWFGTLFLFSSTCYELELKKESHDNREFGERVFKMKLKNIGKDSKSGNECVEIARWIKILKKIKSRDLHS